MPEPANNIDDLIKESGGCGWFQLIIFIACFFSELPMHWSMMMMVFGGYNPGKECVSVEFNDSSTPRMSNNTFNGNSNVIDFSTGSTFLNSSFNKNENFGTRNLSWVASVKPSCDLDPLVTKTRCPGTIKFKESESTIVTEWNLDCDRARIVSVIISIQMAGVLLGSHCGGYMSTKYGRKVGTYGPVALCLVANAVAVFCKSWIMYAVVRFFIGVSIGGVFSSKYVFCSEFLTQRWRGYVGGIPEFDINTTLFALVAYMLKDWRNIHIATAVAAALGFLPVFCIPESMRWLAVRGKVSKAVMVARMMASVNGKPLPNTDIRTTFIQNTKEYNRDQNEVNSFTDLFRCGLHRPTLVMGVVWFSVSAVFYALSFGIKALSGNFYINFFIVSAITVPGVLFEIVVINRIGRRWVTILYLGAGALVSLSIVPLHFAFTNEAEGGLATTALAITCSVLTSAAWYASLPWLVELYPTTVRALACGWANSLARIGGIVAPYIIPENALPMFASFLIMGVLLFVSCACLWTLPETKGKPLQETAVDQEGNTLPETKLDSAEIPITKTEVPITA